VRQFDSLLSFGVFSHKLLNSLFNWSVIRLSSDQRLHFSLGLFILLLRHGDFILSLVGLVHLRVIYFTFLTENIVITLARSTVYTLIKLFVELFLLMFKWFFSFPKLQFVHSIFYVVSDKLVFFAFILLLDPDSGLNLCIVQGGDFFFPLLHWNTLLFYFLFGRLTFINLAEDLFILV